LEKIFLEKPTEQASFNKVIEILCAASGEKRKRILRRTLYILICEDSSNFTFYKLVVHATKN
jgi:hypothetical protein